VVACTADKRQTEAQVSSTLSVAPATMARVGTVDDRYQSYNVEMLEVTGGRFWKPYKDIPNLDVRRGFGPDVSQPAYPTAVLALS
jgi:hypothetical protein